MIVVMLMGVASITVFADDEIDYSFYKLSSDAAECFSRKLAPTDDKAAGVLKANENEQSENKNVTFHFCFASDLLFDSVFVSPCLLRQ